MVDDSKTRLHMVKDEMVKAAVYLVAVQAAKPAAVM